MSDKMSGFHTYEIYDPDIHIGILSRVDGSYTISIDHSSVWITGDLDILINVIARIEAHLEHEQIMRRKFEDGMLEKTKANAK